MLYSELMDLAARLEELEKPKAQERQREGGRAGGIHLGRGKPQVESLAPIDTKLSYRGPRTDDAVARALGMGTRSYQRVRKVSDARTDAELSEKPTG
jgi:hypothetical protein